METTKNYLQWTMDDIVFDNRNKAYGAYQLRQLTKDHLRTGLLVTVFLSGLFIGLSMVDWTFGAKPTSIEEIEQIFDLHDIVSPVHEVHVQPPAAPATTTSSINQSAEMQVVQQTSAPPAEVPTSVEQVVENIGPSGTEAAVGTGISSTSGSILETPTSEPYNISDLEVAPVFPGGDAALIKFLRDHANYPTTDREMGNEGKVLMRFVVMEDGTVSGVKIVKSVSPGLDKESVRVVKLLPNFVPGKQHGKPVRVYFNLPMVWRLH